MEGGETRSKPRGVPTSTQDSQSFEDFLASGTPEGGAIEALNFGDDYRLWIERYPQYAVWIFGCMLASPDREPSLGDIKFFQQNGVDLDRASTAYRTDSTAGATPLEFACEFRREELVAKLLASGANVHAGRPLAYLATGHSPLDDETGAEPCLRLLIQAGVRNELPLWSLESCGRFKDPYVAAFFRTCGASVELRGWA